MMMPGFALGAIEVGGYVSAWAAVAAFLLLLIWARVLTWMDKDATPAYLPRQAVNSGYLGLGLLGFLAFFLMPGFWLALVILSLCVIAGPVGYLIWRNQTVGLKDLKVQLANFVQNLTPKSRRVVAEVPMEIQFVDSGNALLPPPSNDAPDRVGFEVVQTVFTEPLRRGAELIELSALDGNFVCTYRVDGVTYTGRTVDKNGTAAAAAYLRVVSGLDVKEKRKPQVGKVKISINGRRRELQIQTAGSSAGEQIKVIPDAKRRHDRKLEELGMPADQLEQIKQVIESRQGVVVVAAPKDQGLTSLLYAILRHHDAFVSQMVTIERMPDTDLEGINQNRLAVNAPPAEELKTVGWVVSQQPDVIMISPLEEPRSAQELLKFAAEEGRRVYVGLRAGSTFDALTQWRKIVGDDRLAVKNLQMVIAGRLVRKLCNACKVGYAPDPQTLRKLNMDPGKVTKLFQARQEPLRDAKGNEVPCEFCHDLRFLGQVGIYESFPIDDAVREVVGKGGTAEQLKAVFRKVRAKLLQERALEQVQAGETSVQEVLRVLRPEGSGSEAKRSSIAPRKAPAAATE